MGDAELAQRYEGGVIDVGKLTAAVFSEAAIDFGGLIGVAEMAYHELVNMRSGWMIHV